MALFGSDYESYIRSVDRGKFVDHFLNRRKYRSPLQVAFATNEPRSDEIVLWILEYSGVVTNQRLFLLNDNELAHPPIELCDVETYQLRGISKLRASVRLRDGSNINCEVDTGPERKLFMQAVKAARDPLAKEKLAIAPSTRRTAKAEQSEMSTEHKAALAHLYTLSGQLAGEEIAEHGIAVIRNFSFASKTNSPGIQKTLNLWAGRALLGIAGDLLFGGDDRRETGPAVERSLAIIGISAHGNIYGGLIGFEGASADARQLLKCQLQPESVFRSHISRLKAAQTSGGLTGITLRTENGKTIKCDFPMCIVPDNHRWPIRVRKYRDSVQKQD
jgi:hypothetical protein